MPPDHYQLAKLRSLIAATCIARVSQMHVCFLFVCLHSKGAGALLKTPPACVQALTQQPKQQQPWQPRSARTCWSRCGYEGSVRGRVSHRSQQAAPSARTSSPTCAAVRVLRLPVASCVSTPPAPCPCAIYTSASHPGTTRRVTPQGANHPRRCRDSLEIPVPRLVPLPARARTAKLAPMQMAPGV